MIPENTNIPKQPDLDSAWKMLCDLRDTQNHFNEIQANYRRLASTWLLADFGAMGFLLSTKLSVSVPTEVIVFCVALAGSSGILLLWVLDTLVYHRLLDAAFKEALKIEDEYPSLPQVYNNMRVSQPKGQVTSYTECFYIGIILVPLVFGGGLFSYWCFSFGPRMGIGAIIAIGGVMYSVGRFVWHKSPNPALPQTPMRNE